MWYMYQKHLLDQVGGLLLLHFTENYWEQRHDATTDVYVVVKPDYHHPEEDLFTFEADEEGQRPYYMIDSKVESMRDYESFTDRALAEAAFAIAVAAERKILAWSHGSKHLSMHPDFETGGHGYVTIHRIFKTAWGDSNDGTSLAYYLYSLEESEQCFTLTNDYYLSWFNAVEVKLPKVPPCCLNCKWGFQGNHGDEPTDCQWFGYLDKHVRCSLWAANYHYEE